MRLAIVVGVRPQFIKLAPLLDELRPRHDVTVLNTDQHYDRALSTDLFEDLGAGSPDVRLKSGRGSRSCAAQGRE